LLTGKALFPILSSTIRDVHIKDIKAPSDIKRGVIMRNMFIRITLFLLLFTLIDAYLIQAATDRRIALIIGNNAYSSGPLKNPVNDATDMAAMLKKLGFVVMLKKNASLQEMEEAVEAFGNLLKRGGVGLFYYAGHGVQVNGTNYLLPIGVKINKESDIKYLAVDANKILDEMAAANNGLNIVLLDACRDNPFTRSFRNATRGLAIVGSAPSGTFISYSTSPGNVAHDGNGRNSPYTAALLKHIGEPGLSINDVFMKVRQNVRKGTGQTPWELSSLEGNFYFNPGKTVKTLEKEKLPEAASKDEVKEEASTDLENEKRKIAAEQEKLRQERELLGQQKALAEEQRKLEEERKQLATAKRLSVPTANEIRRDGRFIAYDNGTVLDTKTNLMWAAKDNGMGGAYVGINWSSARSYCENYREGGYTDWRMPTHNELAGLFDSNKSRTAKCNATGMVRITELIDLNCWYVWGAETDSMFLVGSTGAVFNFKSGILEWAPQIGGSYQALPVRSAK
jgi:hypothetical protein